LFTSSDNLLSIKSKKMRGAGRVARMGKGKTDVRLWRGN
jgi:hypothetical protein